MVCLRNISINTLHKGDDDDKINDKKLQQLNRLKSPLYFSYFMLWHWILRRHASLFYFKVLLITLRQAWKLGGACNNTRSTQCLTFRLLLPFFVCSATTTAMKGLNWIGLLLEIKWLPINRRESQTKDAYSKKQWTRTTTFSVKILCLMSHLQRRLASSERTQFETPLQQAIKSVRLFQWQPKES